MKVLTKLNIKQDLPKQKLPGTGWGSRADPIIRYYSSWYMMGFQKVLRSKLYLPREI